LHTRKCLTLCTAVKLDIFEFVVWALCNHCALV
jgi:hypothetical protein